MYRQSSRLFVLLVALQIVPALTLSQTSLPTLPPGTVSNGLPVCYDAYCQSVLQELKGNVAIEASSYGVISVLNRTAPNTWVGEQAIFRPDASEPPRPPPYPIYHDFGSPIALDGRVLLISGGSKMFMFRRPGDTWIHSQTIDLPKPPGLYRAAPIDIAFHEGTAVVLARHWSSTYSTLKMHVYTRRDGEPFVYNGEITPVRGKRIALQRGTLISIDQNADGGRGAVHVYRRSSAGWTIEQKLVGSGTQPGDGFGTAFAFDRDTIVVSAPWQDNPAEPWLPGAVYTFTRDRSPFAESDVLFHEPFARLPESPEEVPFGGFVALSGERLLVHSGSLVYRGYEGPPPVTLYERRSERWIATAGLGCPGIMGLALSGDHAMLVTVGFPHPNIWTTPYELPPLGTSPPSVPVECF